MAEPRRDDVRRLPLVEQQRARGVAQAVQRHRETGETGTAPSPTEDDASADPDADAADGDPFADVPDDVLAEAEAAALAVIDRYRHQQREDQTDDR